MQFNSIQFSAVQCSAVATNKMATDKQTVTLFISFSHYILLLFSVLLHCFIYVTVVCNDTSIPILYFIVNLDFDGGTTFGSAFYLTARDDECMDRLDKLYGGETGIYSEELFFSLNGYYGSTLYQTLAAKHDYRVRPPPPPEIAGGTAATTTKQILLIIGLTTLSIIDSFI